ncbi:CaiB/BaiF CoA transferase family protein [Rhodococcus opacus]|uniref:CaiB/BaiF CoA transferase family protein n=1 Tax=Rhodococcus opacus TaxID=37919 RepID=UPI001C44CB12|nr:CaiB/BaiF CoA-transferase family protein [Rhodococcus opacus]MBV6763076.1 CoA transferase [Rhodococcus opacus]
MTIYDSVAEHEIESESEDSSRPFRPLEGIVVVSLEQAVAAPFATRQLADLGARVIKIERPISGDSARGYDTTVHGQSSHFVWLNRGKESIELDVKSPEGNEVLHRLVQRADVVIQNLAPGAADRLGIGSADLADRYPELITCDISGYGSGGPYSDKKAYDLLIQCEAGLVSITGTEESPAKVGISIADIATGMYAYTGILTAILERNRTGRGARLEISMLEALGEWMNYPLLYSMYGGTQPARAGASHATIAPYGPFTCSDGVTINVGLQNEREWDRFCAIVLAQPQLATDSRFAGNHQRAAHRRELDDIITESFSAMDSIRARELLDKAAIAFAEQRTVRSFANHPQLKARARWDDVTTPSGVVQTLIPPVTVDGSRPRLGAVPRLGEHTNDIIDWVWQSAENRLRA